MFSHKKSFSNIVLFLSVISSICSLFGCSNSIFTNKSTTMAADAKGRKLISYSYQLKAKSVMPVEQFTVEKTDSNTCRVIFVKDFDRASLNLISDTIEVDIALFDKIEEIVKQHEMYAYKPSYTPKELILDGERWKMSLNYDGVLYQSTGENAYPNDNGMKLITDLVHQALESAKR